MRFFRFQSALAVAAALAAFPAYGQAASPPPVPTMTPPGSITPLPLMPAGGGPGAAGQNANMIPPMPMSSSNAYSGLGANPLLPGMGGGQGSDFSSLLSGSSSLPLSLTLDQLNSQWRRMTVTGNVDLGDETQVLTSLLGSAGLGVYYTKGQTETVGNVSYLVAYQSQPQILNVRNLMQMIQTAMATSKPPAPQVLTPQTPLMLSLLNLQTIGSLTSIQPFNLSKEIADSRAEAADYYSLIKALKMFSPMPSMAPPAKVYHPKPKKKYPPS